MVKLPGDELLIHNAINMDETSMRELEDWGTPRFIVVPNSFHRLDCAAYKARYSSAQVVCPRAAVPRVSKVAQVDLTFDEFPEVKGVSLRHVEGTKQKEGVLVVQHEADSTVVLNDLVFNMPHATGLAGWVLRHITDSSGGPRVSRIAKMFFVADKASVAEDLRNLAAVPGVKRLIVSHHETLDSSVAETLRTIAGSF